VLAASLEPPSHPNGGVSGRGRRGSKEPGHLRRRLYSPSTRKGFPSSWRWERRQTSRNRPGRRRPPPAGRDSPAAEVRPPGGV